MSEGRRLAILIAASEFPEEPSLDTLRCPKNDVEGMAEVLTSPDYGMFEEPRIFFNEPQHKVLPAMNRIFRQAHRQDQILIYYSGHGKQDAAGHLHLATADTDAEALETTSIAVGTLRRLIDNYSCKQVALILDCCFSGAIGKDFLKSSVDDRMQQTFQDRGIYILTASTSTQTAREKEGDEHSLFTKHILEGIRRGEADRDDDGLVSMSDLYEYVRVRVPREAPQHPTKWEFGVSGDELIIARSAKLYSADRLRTFREKIKSIDDYLLPQIFDFAYKVTRENQPKRDKALLALMESLTEGRITIAEFSSRWLQITKTRESGQPQQLSASPSPSKRPPKQPMTAAAGEGPTVGALPPLRSARFQTVTLKENGDQASRRTLEAQYFVEDLGEGVAIEMVKIPAGEFRMGSTENEAREAFANARRTYKDAQWAWFERELPQHRVNLPEFFMGRFQVTREQWRQVARLPKVEIDLKEDPSHFKDSWKQPVENVSWDDAVEFCARLQQKTGRVYRLPSEAEWEYATRAGTTTPFAFGPTITPAIVNYDGNHPYGSAPKGEYRGKTIEAGSLGVANGFGLYDMHGNVWEWCEDVYHDSYGGKHGAPPADGSAWRTGGEQGIGDLRGGSCSELGSYCRSAYRVRVASGYRSVNVGFRVVYGPRTH